jgi:hypothetical protein
MRLRAISLWNPWAALLLTPFKIHETRGWAPPPAVRGQVIAIHAAKKMLRRDQLDPKLVELCDRVFGPDWETELPRGALLGTARLADYRRVVMPAEVMTTPDDILTGDWDIGRYVWRMTEKVAFARPVPSAGRQGFFNVEIDDGQ